MEARIFEDARPLAIPVCILAFLIGLLLVFQFGLDLYLNLLIPRVLDHDTAALAEFQRNIHGMASYQKLGNLVMIVIFLINIVLFCLWLYRAAANNRAFGARGQSISPGWSVGWFFIPFANLVMGYRSMLQVWSNSLDLSGRPVRGRWIPVLAWWLLYLASSALIRISTMLLEDHSTGLLGVLHGGIWEMSGMALRILSVVLFIHIVWKVSRLQRELARAPDFELEPGAPPAELPA